MNIALEQTQLIDYIDFYMYFHNFLFQKTTSPATAWADWVIDDVIIEWC